MGHKFMTVGSCDAGVSYVFSMRALVSFSGGGL